MEQLEILELRTTQNDHQVIDQKIKKIIREFQTKNSALSTSVYRNSLIDTDYSLHIKYDRKHKPLYSKMLIKEFCEILSQHGMVYHSIWINMSRHKSSCSSI